MLEGSALEPIETYAAYFKGGMNKRYRMEASPRYIFGGARIAETIYQYLGPIRIIFVLRDPVTRMVSYFQQMKNSGELPVTMSMDEYAQRALEELPAVLAANNGKPVEVYRESIFTRGLAQGFYVDYLEGWYEVFPESIHINFFEHIRQNSQAAVEEVCRWLGLDTSVYKSTEFTQENRSIEHKNATLLKIASRINDRFEPFWRKHKNVKRWIRDIYFRLNEERSGNTPLSQAVRAELERVYAFRNQKLRLRLCDRGYRNLPAWLV
jgi:Sulfotransferase domain